MARSMWKGSLAFGLVNIPVELYSATRDHRPKFRLLHAKDEAPYGTNASAGPRESRSAWEDLVKGDEYEKGRFVVLTKDDFKTAAIQKTKTIDILDFVDSEEIDERYFETPYYLQPAKGCRARVCAVCARRSESPGKLGIARSFSAKRSISRRSRSSASPGADDDAICRRTRGSRDFNFPKREGHPARRTEDGDQLIDNLAATWDPEKYTDEYRDNLMKVIQAKLKGRKPRLQERRRLSRPKSST